MTAGGDPALPWVVIRHDGNGNRYRVGSYASRSEAEKVAERLDGQGGERLYTVERVAGRVS
ncbi:SPOR domain-containing protein [Streptomyces sp. TP-A0874]|uniref:SPOR domain-containing protein n=1 Tax=Streptomyces sp. TP-A0874 TaxID=549819 RepID=UPI0008533F49|nr:SPOR domain-containing protein [Streptomyces sp. TP-A0874]